MKLYEITSAIRDLLSSVNDAGGELTDNEIALLDQLAEARADKFDACCALIREWEAFVAVRKAEIDRLRAGIKTHENNADRLKQYMLDSLQQTGDRELQTALFKCWVQSSPVSVQPDGSVPVDELPYKRITVEADCKAARDHWQKTGEPPTGFKATKGEHLRIK